MEKGVQYKEMCPLEDCQADFIQMPKTRGKFRFLLVFVDTFFWMGRGVPYQN